MISTTNNHGAATNARTQRLRQLQAAGEKAGTVHLSDAAKLLNVSEMTVRRDLASDGATLACLGGYVMDTSFPTAAKYALEQERDQHAQHKLAACLHASRLIK